MRHEMPTFTYIHIYNLQHGFTVTYMDNENKQICIIQELQYIE